MSAALPPIEAVRAACAKLRNSEALCTCQHEDKRLGPPCRSAVAEAAKECAAFDAMLARARRENWPTVTVS